MSVDMELYTNRFAEKVRQGEEILVENSWWQNFVIHKEQSALKDGSLVEVPVDADTYSLIGPIRRGEEPRSLRPKALDLLNKIGFLWKEKIREKHPSGEAVRLSVSSLYRTIESLEERIKSGLAVANIGPHQAGAAIDFDPNGYYLGEERKAVSRSNSDFNGKYADALKDVLVGLEKNGDCHVIWEKGYKMDGERVVEYDACWHVCLNPNFNNEEN